jgi:ABC-type transporter Mla maintaining outer membrane lipid asymmetry permease subunit MlaE
MARKGLDRWPRGIALGRDISGPMQAIGGLFVMSFDAVRFVFRRPFQWREFLDQCRFVARVSLAPTLLVAIPFTVLVSFIINILLRQLGAADLSGAGTAFGAVIQVGPLVAFAAGITLLTGVPEVIISCVKAALFGLIAGLVACYRGLSISGGGAKALGNAVKSVTRSTRRRCMPSWRCS